MAFHPLLRTEKRGIAIKEREHDYDVLFDDETVPTRIPIELVRFVK